MSVAQRRFRVGLYLLWGILMTALTFVLGGLPLKSLRRGAGRMTFWSVCTLAVAVMIGLKLYLLATFFGSLVILIGFLSEFEEQDLSLVASSFFALLTTALIAAGGFAIWVSITGPGWLPAIEGLVKEALDPVLKINPEFKVDIKNITMQLPSVAIIMWMVTIYLSVLLEPRLSAPAAEPVPASRFRNELATLKLPDFVVWTFIVSLIGAFGAIEGVKMYGVHEVSINIFNICILAFFFQGLAVIGMFLSEMKMGWFWQGLLMVILVLQLFIFVSVLGLVDHWMDFRARIAKRRQQVKREI